MQQRIRNTKGEIYNTLPVLAGPHEWEVDGHRFKTVLVREPKERPKLSIVEVRSGHRMGFVEVAAPKTKPYNAMIAVSRHIDKLREKFGDAEVAYRIQCAPALPKA